MGKIDSNIKLYERIEQQIEGYEANYELFWQEIEVFFKGFELDLILYDETEKFRDWYDE